MADGETPSPEAADVPKGPETQGDPVLIEAEEALRRASEQETTAFDLREKGIRVTLIDGALDGVKKKIKAEDEKDPKDFDKLAKLTKKKAELEAKRSEIMAIPDAKADEKIAKVEASLGSHATELEGRLKEIDRVQARMEVVQTEIDKYKSADDQEGQLKYSAALKEMGELTKALAALEKEGTEEDQLDQHKATLAAEKKAAAMREAAHAQDAETAEKGLSEFEGNPDKEQKDPERPDAEEEDKDDKDKNTSSEGEEEKAARKKELLHNALHKVAYGLAVDLEKNYPGVDGNAYEKMEWNGKAFLLKMVVMFGGAPKWAELLKDNPPLSTFLDKKVGITFVQEDVKKDGVVVPGEKRWAVKWSTPEKGWEPGIVKMADVFETVYGKDGAAKAMEGIKETTTLKEMKDNLPVPAVEEKDKQTELLIKAMEDAGANGETKVQEFLTNTQNAKKVQKFLEPTEETAVAGTPEGGPEEKTEADPTTKELILDQTTFELKTDDASAKALAEQGIKFTGKSMMDTNDGTILRDFGDAKTVEIKSLGNNMFTLTATTPSIPSATPGGMPSGVKVETSTFTGMDSLVKPKEAT